MGTMKTVSFQPRVGTKRTRPQQEGKQKKTVDTNLLQTIFKPLKETFSVKRFHSDMSMIGVNYARFLHTAAISG